MSRRLGCALLPGLLLALLLPGSATAAEAARPGDEPVTAPKSNEPESTLRVDVTHEDPPAVDRDLDAAIDEVLARPEYRWRLGPQLRPEQQEQEKTWLTNLVAGLLQSMSSGLESLRSWLEWFNRWFRDRFSQEPAAGSQSASTGIALSWLLIVVALIVVCSLLALLWLRSRRRARAPELTLQVEQQLAELAEEESEADQVEPQRWRHWALELADAGSLRPAIRAVHLGVLSELARGNLIHLQRCKSNLDYLVELRRRCRSGEEVPLCFADNVGIFEQVWYGRLSATQQLLQAALNNLDRIGDHGTATV